MSARNPHHASRVNKGPSADDRFTPRYLIEALHKEFRFTVDAASHEASPATQIIGIRPSDGLQLNWKLERVFCNPPFSNIPAWVEKAHIEAMHGCSLIVMLLPWNRQEQQWWQKYVEPWRDGGDVIGPCLAQTIALGGGQYGVKGRVKYGTLDDPEGKRPHNSPNFGSGLVIWRRNH